MKRWLLLTFSLLVLLLLAACAGGTDVAPEEIAAAEEVAGPATNFEPQLDPQRPYSNNDLSLIGNNGRPQFLNSYADW